MNNNNSSGWLWGIAFLLFFVAMNNPSMWGVFFLLLILASAMNNANTRTRGTSSRTRRVSVRRDDNYRYTRNPTSARRTVSTDDRADAMRARRTTDTLEAYPHAVKAAHAAGLYPSTSTVYPSDIGFLIYRDGDEPQIVRDWEAPDDIDYLQPYVELHVPRAASGTVRFEVYDADGKMVYARDEERQLKGGRNLILPKTRLPITPKLALYDGWRLRVLADGYAVAEHGLNFSDAATMDSAPLAAHIGEDGEISAELQDALNAGGGGGISLDDLLSDQEDDFKRGQQR